MSQTSTNQLATQSVDQSLDQSISKSVNQFDDDYECLITIFTGFVGAGKTTVILSLMDQMNNQSNNQSNNHFVWIKNEFGDLAVDTKLSTNQSIDQTIEILNGCICCTSINQLIDAINQSINQPIKPSRIFIETSGSAYSTSLVLEIERLINQSNNQSNNQSKKLPLKIDCCVCVIDALNESVPQTIDQSTANSSVIASYNQSINQSIDQSTARHQSKFTDVLLINKWEDLSEQSLDRLIDRLIDRFPDTPRIKTDKGTVDPALILGQSIHQSINQSNNQIGFGGSRVSALAADQTINQSINTSHFQDELTVLSIKSPIVFESANQFDQSMKRFDKQSIYRIKGFVPIHSSDQSNNQSNKMFIVNWSFGKYTLTEMKHQSNNRSVVLINDQSNNQSTDQSIDQSIDQSNNQLSQPLQLTIMGDHSLATKYAQNQIKKALKLSSNQANNQSNDQTVIRVTSGGNHQHGESCEQGHCHN